MPTILIIIAIFIYFKYFGDESGCEKYASKYSCEYVEKKATYEVWYWFNVWEGNEKDERYIGTATGLSDCRSQAYWYYTQNESFRPWTSRSYICILMKDGVRMEKHRKLDY